MELPEFLKPRLRLFMSADIVGSTALKQSPRKGPEVSSEWFGIIQGFYLEIQKEFIKHWSDVDSKLGDKFLGDPPELWKVIGDEAVFVKEITDHTPSVLLIGLLARGRSGCKAFYPPIRKARPQVYGLDCWFSGHEQRSRGR